MSGTLGVAGIVRELASVIRTISGVRNRLTPGSKLSTYLSRAVGSVYPDYQFFVGSYADRSPCLAEFTFRCSESDVRYAIFAVSVRSMGTSLRYRSLFKLLINAPPSAGIDFERIPYSIRSASH